MSFEIVLLWSFHVLVMCISDSACLVLNMLHIKKHNALMHLKLTLLPPPPHC